jgi:alpha-tubulin suppressor-like RCC1 family protein
VTRPILLTHLAGTSNIKDLCCAHLGAYTMAINTRNEVYVWGYYHGSVSQTCAPMELQMPNEIRSVKQLQCSRNLCSIVDKQGKLWVWAAQKGDENLYPPLVPTQVESLRSNQIKRVYLGHSYIIAMGHTVGETNHQKLPLQ